MSDHWKHSAERRGEHAASGDSGRSAEADAAEGKSCSVTSFEVPEGKSDCQFVGDKVGQTFDMSVDFSGPCGQCEYRQYIKGYFEVDGVELTHMLPGAANPPTYEPGQPMSKVSYLEDGLSPYPGYGPHYGHRDEVGAGDDVYQSPDRATGCQYRGSDFPGISGMVTGETYEIALDFLGEAVDTATDTTLRSSTWKVACSGTVA